MRDLSDPISRQQAITALRALSDDDGYINVPHEVVTDVVRGLPPVKVKQGQTVHSERGESDKLGVKTGKTCEDCISRQAAIDAIWKIRRELQMLDDTHKADRVMHGIYLAKKALEQLPSTQPEIIRCKDCKYRDENWRRVSVKWLPCMDVQTPNNWFCGSAKRGEQDDEQSSH